MTSEETPQIALLIETARGYGRDIALGIARYARLHGPWSFHLTPGDFKQQMPDESLWHGNGIFARLSDTGIAERLLASGLPTVGLDMSTDLLHRDNPAHVFTNLRVGSEAAATLAANHLLELDLPNYGFVGTPGRVWSDLREARFCEILKQQGHTAHVYQTQGTIGRGFWELEVTRLTEWIASLPKPIGIMACNDEHGLYVLDACRRAEARVPDEVAVVGVDNDSLLCELCNPTLSSVVLNGVEGGYRAAGHLAKLMETGTNQPHEIVVDALRVETRQSTDCLGASNKPVASALAYIRKSRSRNVNADSVAEHVQISRRELDSQFRSSLGRSVAAEIQRVRLKHAQQLLEDTDHPIPAIAEAAGYSSASYMIQVFQRELTTTPTKYRSRIRSLSAAARRDGLTA